METTPYPLRIPQEILTLTKLRAKEEYLDQTTALRQLLYLEAEECLLNLVESGRIAISKTTELLNITIQDIHRLAEKHEIQLDATAKQQKKAVKQSKNY